MISKPLSSLSPSYIAFVLKAIRTFLQITLVLNFITAASCTYANNGNTNRNNITDLFDQAVEDRQGIKQFLKSSRFEAERGVTNKGAVQALGANENELEGKTSELNSINAEALESRGQEERVKEENSYYNQLEIDYNDPKIINHKKDIDLITAATDKLLTRLADGLKDLGIDCKTLKGDKELEPEYRLEIGKEHLKDTIYNQQSCEELRNHYNCNDMVTLKCSRTGLRYGEWQDREIALGGHMLYNSYIDWGWSVKWKKKRHGWHISGYPGSESSLSAQGINDGVRLFIANNFGVGIEQIHPVIGFPPGGRGIGNITPLYSRWQVAWDQYIFKYKYRDSYQVCEVWQEEWSQRCKLQ